MLTWQSCLSGHYFWVLDRNKVPGAAQGITQVWGVPSPIDTVFTRCNCQGKTYIFKVRLFLSACLSPLQKRDRSVWGPCRETSTGDLKMAWWTRVTQNLSKLALMASGATSQRRCLCLSTGRGESRFTSSREVMKTKYTEI